jgi:beta-RFAP synthase
VRRLIDHIREQMEQGGRRLPPVRLRILGAPAEHVGLGVGTQLSLAVARAVWNLAGVAEVPIEELARLTGRGARSGIGLHGFDQGGLIVDGGRSRAEGVPPMVARLAFPQNWRILIVQPPGRTGLHGVEESRAFAELPPITEQMTDRLCRLVLLDILPAVVERELGTFGAALSELQAQVGSCFAPRQGGIYTAPLAGQIVLELKRDGFEGIGQSSWGPTLYAFSDRPEEEISALGDRLCQRLGFDPTAVFVTEAANQGASLELEG